MDKSDKSVHIAINDYPGISNDLHGCVNDAIHWESLLKDTYNFQTKILLNEKATLKNVKKELIQIISNSRIGDNLVFTFSGHGTSIKDISGGSGDEEDGRDEALCLYDGILIDDDIHKIIQKLPKNVGFTMISDSCHSGTVTRTFIFNIESQKPKYAAEKDTSKKSKNNKVKKKVFIPQENMKEILISGCKANEYSYDASFNGKFEGAFSHYAIEILTKYPDISYLNFYTLLRDKLPSGQYPQTPQLEGSLENKSEFVFRM